MPPVRLPSGPPTMCIAVTDRLLLRRLRPGDARALGSVLGDPLVMRYSDGVLSPEQVRAWIRGYVEEQDAAWGLGMWAVVERRSEEVIGYCGLSRFPQRCTGVEAEIGFRLAQRWWGRGYATEAALAVRDRAFNMLKLPRLIAIVDPANVASVRVAEKLGMGFEREIMFESYDHPDHLYALDRSERRASRGD